MTPADRVRAALPLTCAALLLTWLAATVLNGSAPQPAPTGLVPPSPAVAWGVRLSELAALATSVACVGSLLAALAAVRSRGQAVRTARNVAVVWAAVLATGALLEAVDVAPARPAGPGPLLGPLALLALAVALSARADRRTVAGALTAAVAVALLPALDGHGAAGDEVLTGALVVHVVAALFWSGGLLGLLLVSLREPAALQAATPRFSTLALVCYVALACSGALAVGASVPLADLLPVGGYVAVVLGKVVVLLGLGVVGRHHRRRTLPRLAAGRPGAFVSLAAGEVVVMGVALGLAATLTRTSPPSAGAATPSPASHGHPDPLVELTWAGVLTEARPNAVVLLVAALLLGGYLSRVRTRLRGGAPWPVLRTTSWVAASALAVLMTCSGVAVAAHSRPGVLVAQLLAMTLLVPALLLAASPWQLLAPGTRALLPAWFDRPGTGAVVVCALLVTLQYTPVLSGALASPWWHLLLLLLATCCGLLLWWPTLATPPGRTRAPAAERAGWLLVVALALAIMALRLQRGGDLLTADWFLELRLVGADPADDRRSAALTTSAAAVSLLVAAGAVARLQSATSRPPGGHHRGSTVPRSSSLPMDP